MFGRTNSFEQPQRKGATPEEIMSAMKAADVVAREKAEARKKLDAERADAKRIEKLWLEKSGKEKGPHIISEADVAEAENQVGKKFERLN